jgi:hypothetical protein
MVPLCWPVALGEFRAFGDEISVRWIVRGYETIEGDERRSMMLYRGDRWSNKSSVCIGSCDDADVAAFDHRSRC